MTTIRKVLLDFFDDEVSEVRVVIEKSKDISPDFCLTKDSRPVLALVNHIAQIPRIDVDIYSGKFASGEDTHKMEIELDKPTIDEALKVFEESCEYLHNYFANMSDEDLQKKTLKPFYEPDSKPRSWNHFLPKLIAHIALHKGVLWSYLKTAEANVNMFTYYGSK